MAKLTLQKLERHLYGAADIMQKADKIMVMHHGELREMGKHQELLAQKGEWLRDTADLHLPQAFSPTDGPYRLYIGLYNPSTLERLPFVNDTSGENAVVIDLPIH